MSDGECRRGVQASRQKHNSFFFHYNCSALIYCFTRGDIPKILACSLISKSPTLRWVGLWRSREGSNLRPTDPQGAYLLALLLRPRFPLPQIWAIRFYHVFWTIVDSLVHWSGVMLRSSASCSWSVS